MEGLDLDGAVRCSSPPMNTSKIYQYLEQFSLKTNQKLAEGLYK